MISLEDDKSGPFFTIGHSTHPIVDFVNMVTSAKIEMVIDVRTIPKSRTNPQYNRETLPGTLSEFRIGYEHVAALGGRRGKARDVSASVNAFWQNQSFHNYADYALTESFHTGLARLRTVGHERRCVIMCAEAVWWRCHRRIIADYLIVAGEAVFHILGRDHIEPAHVTAAAAPGPDGTLVYPATE